MFDFINIIIKGGPVMVPLIAFSIITLTVVIERWLFWRRISDRHVAEEALSLIERGELSKASEAVQRADAYSTGSVKSRCSRFLPRLMRTRILLRRKKEANGVCICG